uniref:Uncharacterized protein n=1 Tax=uncultured marine virus TaxID=186617 RepID=A0A0F7L982_9VIRU|nr:hypothetical protein [uncultured marine virus]
MAVGKVRTRVRAGSTALLWPASGRICWPNCRPDQSTSTQRGDVSRPGLDSTRDGFSEVRLDVGSQHSPANNRRSPSVTREGDSSRPGREQRLEVGAAELVNRAAVQLGQLVEGRVRLGRFLFALVDVGKLFGLTFSRVVLAVRHDDSSRRRRPPYGRRRRRQPRILEPRPNDPDRPRARIRSPMLEGRETILRRRAVRPRRPSRLGGHVQTGGRQGPRQALPTGRRLVGLSRTQNTTTTGRRLSLDHRPDTLDDNGSRWW